MKHLIASTLTILICFSLPAHAEVDFSKTINLAGKQRMLTQKMAKESLLVALDVNRAENLQSLKASRDLFDKTLKGLQKGDSDLGLEPVKKRKIQTQLEAVAGLWSGYSSAINTIIDSGEANEASIQTIHDMNENVLKEMNRAVKFYEAEASQDDLNPALAAALNVSGRQRMLTQKMSKEFFFIALGKEVDTNKDKLQKTKALYDSSLKGLIEGDEDLGLSPAPTDEISSQLGVVSGLWSTFSDAVSSEPNAESIKIVAENNLPLLKESNKVVSMFEAF